MASVKILVVEDESIVAKDIQDILKRQGYDVPAIALSGEQAIEKAEQIQPDLVLMNIVLKGDVDGIEAAEQIRRRFNIPVLYLTAYTDEQTVKRAKITEPFGYITKPFDKRELYTNIVMALYKHKAEEALRKSEQELKIRNRVNNIFLTIPDEQMYAEVLNLVLEVMESKFGTFGYFGENGAFVVPAMTREIYWDKCNVLEKDIIFERGTFSGIWGMAIKEKRTLFSNQGPFNTPKGHIPIKNTMVTPIIFRDEIISAIHVANKANDYDETDQVMLETLARHIAPVLYARLQADKQDKERKRAEESLSKSEAFFRSQFELGNIGIAISTPEKGVKKCNKRLCKILGYNEKELRDIKWTEITHPEDLNQDIEQHNRILSGEIDNYALDKRFIHPDGSIVYTHLTVSVFRNENGEAEYMIASLDDITERKQAEEALRESEKRMKLALEGTDQGLWNWDVVTGTITFDDNWPRVLGYTPGEMDFDFTWWERSIHPDSGPVFKAALNDYLEGREKYYELEYQIKDKSGEWRWIWARGICVAYGEQGEPLRMIGTHRDVTERKRTEAAYHSLVDHSLQGLAIFQEGRVVFANQAMADITGYTAEEMLTLPPEKVQEFVHPEDRELVWGRHRGRLNGEELPERYEFRGIRKDGSICWLELHASRIEYQGKPAIQAAYVDITEEKRAREALRESRDYLEKLTNSMWDAVFSVKMPERVIEWANDSFRLIGYEPQECIGKTTEFLYPDDSEFLDFGNKLKGAMAAGKDVLHAEQILKRKNGETFPAEITTTFFREKGEIVRVTSIVRDVSERKKAEDVIAKLAKFPDEDPYPVLRISGHGTVIYANTASAILLKVWGCRVGESLPDQWQGLVLDALSSGQSQQTEVKCDGRIFSLTFAPVVDTNYVNVYGLDITERKKAEDELVEYQMKLKAMASEMLLTEERERQRLAMGLHDEVCQKLVLTKLALESSMNLVSDSNVLASLRIVCEGIGETIEQADSLKFELSNPVLRQLGFVIALEKYLTEEIQQKYGIEYELQSDEQLSTLPDEIKNCLFRVTRELLTNVVKHAQSNKIRVSARESQSQIYVRVQDDGVGFKESQAGSKVSQTARFGLFSIREQLEYLGGHLEIESEPGQGTKATVVVPLRKQLSKRDGGKNEDTNCR